VRPRRTPLCASLLALAPQELGKTQVLQLPDGVSQREGELVDADGDGQLDLVVVAWAPDSQRPRRVRVHYRRPGAAPFTTEPDYEVQLTDEVVAYAIADVHPDSGSEVVLVTAEGAFAWRPRAPNERQQVVLLARLPFLWQVPSGGRVASWQRGVVDVDGDGDVDLLLPGPDGFRVLVQERADGVDFSAQSFLRVPDDPEDAVVDIGPSDSAQGSSSPSSSAAVGSSSDGSSLEFLLQFDDEVGSAAPLLSVTRELPVPWVIDWNADGRLDVLAQGRRELFVWQQVEGGRFPEDPLRLTLPVERDRKRELDLSYSAHVAHLDADRRADYVVVAGDKRSESVRTQVLLYRNGEGGPFPAGGLPTQLLVLAGFAGLPRLYDVDMDGLEDFVIGSFRPDLLDAIRSASSKTLDVEMILYRNLGGSFSKSPDMTWKVSLPLGSERFNARFFGDVTGDGLSDILLRRQEERVAIHMVRATNGRWSVVERPVWELNVERKAQLRFANGTHERPPELLVLEDRQVVHVRFAR